MARHVDEPTNIGFGFSPQVDSRAGEKLPARKAGGTHDIIGLKKSN